MNVLMLGELYHYGGASEMMEILAKNLNGKHQVTLIYGYNPNKDFVGIGHYVIYNNDFIRKVNNKFRYWIEKFHLPNLFSRLFITHIIKKKKIEIIHFHAIQGGFLSLKDIKWICEKNKVIWTIHDTWPFTGGCMYYWKCNLWMSDECINCLENNLQMKYRNTHINFIRKKQAWTGKKIFFVAPSQWMIDNLRYSFIKNEEIVFIENGIDLELFKPLDNIDELKQKYGIINDRHVVMFVASSVTSPFKGWKYLVEALKKLKNPKDYQLLVVGNNTRELEILNISMVKLDFVKEKKILNEIYNIADVLVLPSEQDNFPTVTLEAQAAGTPVIAFTTGGIAEQIGADTGWLVEKMDSERLCQTIETVFEGSGWKEILLRKQKNARERCMKLYDENNMSQKYEQLYLRKLRANE